jgi:hypothetical protein
MNLSFLPSGRKRLNNVPLRMESRIELASQSPHLLIIPLNRLNTTIVVARQVRMNKEKKKK